MQAGRRYIKAGEGTQMRHDASYADGWITEISNAAGHSQPEKHWQVIPVSVLNLVYWWRVHFLHTSSEYMSDSDIYDSDMAFQTSVFSQTRDRGLQSHFVLTWLMSSNCRLIRI